MSFGFQKTTNNASKTIDSSNITVNGSDLTSTINQILQDNVSDSANFAGCATLAGTNTFTGTNTMNALTIPSTMAVSSSAISLGKLPRLSSALTPSDPNDLSTKKYIDDSTGSLITNLLGTFNTWSNSNTFMGAFRVGSLLTFSPSNLVFNKMPITDIDRTSEITDDKHFATKKYVDQNGGNLIESANAWTNTNTFNDAVNVSGTGNSLTVQNCCTLSQSTGATFSSIPKTDYDYTNTINDDKQLITKKYVDNKFNSNNNFGTTTQTMYNQTITNTLSIPYCLQASLNGPVEFSYIPTLATEITENILDDKQLTNKKYVDDRTVMMSPTSYQFGASTYTYQIGSDYILEVPNLGTSQANTNATNQFYKEFYINFPSNITEGGITKLSPKNGVWFDYTHVISASANMPDTGITSYNGEISRVKKSTPFTMSDLNRDDQLAYKDNNYFNSAFRTNTGRIFVGIHNSKVTVYSPYSVPTVWNNGASQTPVSSTFIMVMSANIAMSYTKSYFPINIQYVNDYKVKITFGFPLMSNSPTLTKIYIQEITASLTLLSSAPQDPTHSATANGGILFPARNPPSISNVGGCWLSLN